MTYLWPQGSQCAAALSFDVDGESSILAVNPKYAERLSAFAWARYAPTRLLMLSRLIEHIQSFEAVWLTTCGAIAEHHVASQRVMAEGAAAAGRS